MICWKHDRFFSLKLLGFASCLFSLASHCDTDKNTVSAPVLCCSWVDLINKARDLAFFSTAAILQSWITNTGMNFLDTAYFFQSNIWMHMSERFSSFLTLLGVGGASACFMGLEMLYKEVGWVFYHSFFHLHRHLEHQSFVVFGCHYSFLLETFVSCLKICRFSLLCTPPGCWTGTQKALLAPAQHFF